MRSGGAVAAFPDLRPRLARVAGWALLGAATWLLGWWAMQWLASQGLDTFWNVGQLEISALILIDGFLYSGALGIALWRGGHAGWRSMAGFAVAAALWFEFGWNAGLTTVEIGTGLPPSFHKFLTVFAGFLTATVWLSLSALLCLPDLRRRRAIAWLLGPGVAYAVLAGAFGVADFFGVVQVIHYLIAVWCAVHAAALALALPEPRGGGGEIRNGGP